MEYATTKMGVQTAVIQNFIGGLDFNIKSNGNYGVAGFLFFWVDYQCYTKINTEEIQKIYGNIRSLENIINSTQTTVSSIKCIIIKSTRHNNNERFKSANSTTVISIETTFMVSKTRYSR